MPKLYTAPGRPINLEAIASSDTVVTLRWSAGDATPVDQYYVRYVNLANQNDTGDGFSTETSYSFDNLQPGATYGVNVAALNSGGYSPTSDWASVTLTPSQGGNLSGITHIFKICDVSLLLLAKMAAVRVVDILPLTKRASFFAIYFYPDIPCSHQ